MIFQKNSATLANKLDILLGNSDAFFVSVIH